MIKKVYILTILLIGLFSYYSIGQGAQATMRVSVTVVSGSSVDVEKPEIVYLSANQVSDLGTLSFKGIEDGDVFISSANNITLTDKNGESVNMEIKSDREDGSDTNRIRFEGRTDQQMMSSIYEGELTTSIEYF